MLLLGACWWLSMDDDMNRSTRPPAAYVSALMHAACSLFSLFFAFLHSRSELFVSSLTVELTVDLMRYFFPNNWMSQRFTKPRTLLQYSTDRTVL